MWRSNTPSHNVYISYRERPKELPKCLGCSRKSRKISAERAQPTGQRPFRSFPNFIEYLVQQGEFDVFNALDLMENTSFLEKLKFGIGDGNLQYYLYNWKCPAMVPKKIGLVLQ